MPGAIDYSLIDVQPDPDSAEWWQGTSEHRLLVRSCRDCEYRWRPQRPCGAAKKLDENASPPGVLVRQVSDELIVGKQVEQVAHRLPR